MDDFESKLAGNWEVLVGAEYSWLTLGINGRYNCLVPGTSEHHGGQWRTEYKDPWTWLVLELQEATPVLAIGPDGWRPVAWPTVECIALVNGTFDCLNFVGGVMRRLVDFPSSLSPVKAPTDLVGPPMPELTSEAVKALEAPPVIATKQIFVSFTQKPPASAGPDAAPVEAKPGAGGLAGTPADVQAQFQPPPFQDKMRGFFEAQAAPAEPAAKPPPQAAPQPPRIRTSSPGVAPGNRRSAPV